MSLAGRSRQSGFNSNPELAHYPNLHRQKVFASDRANY